jgi:hypothetical protein
MNPLDISLLEKSFQKNGFVIINNFLTLPQVFEFRNVLDQYLAHNPSYQELGDSKIIPGFAESTPGLNELNTLHKSSKLNRVLKDVVFHDQNFIFADHSDLHQNKVSGWHRDWGDYLFKDRGNGDEDGLWSDDCLIVKACFLLQDHHDNEHGLWFRPGSHKSNIRTPAIYAKTKATDLIIFDQRILHAGQKDDGESYLRIFNKNRYLITFAFGLNNKHTQIHIKGANLRQEKERSLMKS